METTEDYLRGELEKAAQALDEAHALIVDLRVRRSMRSADVDYRARAVLLAAQKAHKGAQSE
jgi:hypothetical protein